MRATYCYITLVVEIQKVAAAVSKNDGDYVLTIEGVHPTTNITPMNCRKSNSTAD